MQQTTTLEREYKLKIGGNVRKWRNLKSIKQKQLASYLKLSEAAVKNNISVICLITTQHTFYNR